MAKDRLTLAVEPDLLSQLQQSAEAAQEALSPHVARLAAIGMGSAQLLDSYSHRISAREADHAAETEELKKVVRQVSLRCSEVMKEQARLKTTLQGATETAQNLTATNKRLERQLQLADNEVAAGKVRLAEATRKAKEDTAQAVEQTEKAAVVTAVPRAAFIGGVATVVFAGAVLAILPPEARIARGVAWLAMAPFDDAPTAGARLAGYYRGRIILVDGRDRQKAEVPEQVATGCEPQPARRHKPPQGHR
jgi:hypothetical protein